MAGDESYQRLSQTEASSSRYSDAPPPVQVPPRPPTYYNDGPFEVPSSDEEDDGEDITVFDEKTLHDEEEGLLVGKDLKVRI
jgi:hypothetical protein